LSLTLESGQPSVYRNLDKLLIKGTLPAALSFPSAAFLICKAPNGQSVLAEVVEIPQGTATFQDTFTLGNPIAPWPSGTYNIHAYIDVVNGPAPPLELDATFDYQA
jgi:hypothetical protein